MQWEREKAPRGYWGPTKIRNSHRAPRCCLPLLLIAVSVTCQGFATQHGGAAGPKVKMDPQVQAVLDKMATAGVLSPTTLEEAKKTYSFYTTLEGPPEPVFHVEDRQIPGPEGNLTVRIYVPQSRENLPVFVYFHGGGFVAGGLDTHDVPLRAITNRCDCIVVSVAYRLAPEHPYPAATADAYEATAWIAEHASDLGGDSRRIAVGGDGAGGNLATVVTVKARDRGSPNLIYQVLIYPMTDASALWHTWWWESPEPAGSREVRDVVLGLYVPAKKDLKDPLVSPVYANLKGLPPVLILTDEYDPTLDQAKRYARQLRKTGVPTTLMRYPQMVHGFFLMAGQLDAGKDSINQIASALKNVFKRAD